MNREAIIKVLERMKLRQYPPRKRTVLWSFHSTTITNVKRLSLPWMSFGDFRWIRPATGGWEIRERSVAIFMHHRAWTDLGDAIDIIRVLPSALHGDTIFPCLGSRTRGLLLKGEITPEEAFWFTTNTGEVGEFMPKELYNDKLFDPEYAWVDTILYRPGSGVLENLNKHKEWY